MVEPAPKVGAATASAAKPRAAPDDVDPATPSNQVLADVAPNVSFAYAKPPSRHNLLNESNATVEENSQIQKLGVGALKQQRQIMFEAHAAVINGPAEKSFCQRFIPRLFDERSFLSYGEAKRYILITAVGPLRFIFVYSDITDVSPPLYTIPLIELVPVREDPNRPDFYSHTISPEANTGLPFANKSKECLDTVLLKDGDGKIVWQFTFDKNEAGDDAAQKFIAIVKSLEKRK